jgi:hypothetical protein
MSDLPIPLSTDELTKIENDTANGTKSFATGYTDILSDIGTADSNGIDTLSAASKFWYQNAININSNSTSSISNTFIRSVTTSGFIWDSLPVPNLQSISDAIGQKVLTQVIQDRQIEPVATLVASDISVALNQFSQTIGGWGGAFYYWDMSYTTQAGVQTTVGNAILGSNSDYEKFITADALATVAVMNQENVNLASMPLTSRIAEVVQTLGQVIYTAYTAEAPIDQRLQIVGRVLDDISGNNPAGNPNEVDGYVKVSLGPLGHLWVTPSFVFASPTLSSALDARSQIISNEQPNFAQSSQGSSIDPLDTGGYAILTDNGGALPASAVLYGSSDNKTSDIAYNSDGTFADRLFDPNSQSQVGVVSGGLTASSPLTLQNIAQTTPGSPIAVQPVGGTIAGAEANADGSIQLNLSLALNGLPAAVVANTDGSAAVGLDPPQVFQSVVDFAPNGLNGDIEAISLDGSLAVFNTEIGSGATAEVSAMGTVASTEARFTLQSQAGVLKLDQPSAFTGSVFDFIPGDTIDLSGIVASTATLDAGNLLSIGGQTIDIQFDPGRSFTGFSFDMQPDGQGGSNVVLTRLMAGIGYAPSSNSNYIETIDPLTGTIDAVVSFKFNTGYFSATTFTTSQSDAFAVSSSGLLYDISLSTGAISTAQSDAGLDSLAYNGTRLVGLGYNYATSENYVETIDASTGAATLIASFKFNTGYFGTSTYAVSTTDAYATSSSGLLYDVNLATGTVSTVQSDSGLDALSYSGATLVGIGYNTATGENYVETIDATTGAADVIASFKFNTGYFSTSTFTADLTDAFVQSSSGLLYDINLATGAISTRQSDGNLDSAAIAAETSAVQCFAAGTRIATTRGEIPVERLVHGDSVLTGQGEAAMVEWIGRRHIDCLRQPDPTRIHPVRVSAGAFGDKTPSRDLWLSPDHAVLIEGVLIPIKHLVNGSTVVQIAIDEITYYHVELPRHDIILADGLPVESLFAFGDRTGFSNSGSLVRLFPTFGVQPADMGILWDAHGCRPLAVTGPDVDAARAYLKQRSMDLASCLPARVSLSG